MGIWERRSEKVIWSLVIFPVPYFRAKLASTIVDNQEQDLEKTRQYSQKLGVLTEQLQSLTVFLQTKLKEKVGSRGSFSSLPIVSLFYRIVFVKHYSFSNCDLI